MRTFSRPHRAFTLIELVIVILLIGILTTFIVYAVARSRSQSRQVQDMSQMRQIIAGVISHAGINDGRFYSKDDIGNSSYRQVDDPLGLPELLRVTGILNSKQIWLSPNAPATQKKYGNSYAWNRSQNLCGQTLTAVDDPAKTAILWNSYSFTLPSAKNVKEPATNGGPRNAANEYWQFPYGDNTSAHFGYADGHVEMLLIRK